jgi:hypothetical protein
MFIYKKIYDYNFIIFFMKWEKIFYFKYINKFIKN